MTNSDRLSEIQTRLDAATRCPWYHDESTGEFEVWSDRTPLGMDDELIFGVAGDDYQGPSLADARLISAAPADLAFLLSEVRALTERINKARDLIGNQPGDITGAALDAWVILSGEVF